MTTRIHTKIATTIALVAFAVTPCAFAGPSKSTRVQIPPSPANFREPGSTGYVPKATHVVIPAWLTHFREPGSTGFVPKTTLVTATTAPSGGLDWVSALIGAGAALGIALASAGAVMALRKRHALAHV